MAISNNDTEIKVPLSRLQKYLAWISEKIFLDTLVDNAKKRKVKRGCVYECQFGIGIGSEMNKKRPCVVIQTNVANLNSPNTIVAPITHDVGKLPCLVPIADKYNSIGEKVLDGQVNVSNLMCVSKARLLDPITNLTTPEMKNVDIALASSLSLISYYNDLKGKLKNKDNYIEKIKEDRNKAQDILKEIRLLINVNNDDDIIGKLKNPIDKTNIV